MAKCAVFLGFYPDVGKSASYSSRLLIPLPMLLHHTATEIAGAIICFPFVHNNHFNQSPTFKTGGGPSNKTKQTKNTPKPNNCGVLRSSLSPPSKQKSSPLSDEVARPVNSVLLLLLPPPSLPLPPPLPLLSTSPRLNPRNVPVPQLRQEGRPESGGGVGIEDYGGGGGRGAGNPEAARELRKEEEGTE